MTDLDLSTPNSKRWAKWLVVATAVVFLVLALVGCGNPTDPNTDEPNGHTQVFDVPVNGDSVTCVSWKSGHGGGVSCNWEAFNR